MRNIVFHGALRTKFGKSFRMDVKSASEAVRALCCQIKGLREELSRGTYRIAWYDKRHKKHGLPGDALRLQLGEQGNIHIVPVVAGAGLSTGWWEVIAGAALIAAAFVFSPAIPMMIAGSGDIGLVLSASMGASAVSLGSLGSISYGAIASLGFGLALLGAGQLLAPSRQSSDDQASMFALPANNSQQGVAVPVLYGTFLIGSIVIATAVLNADVPIGINYTDLTQVVAGKGGYTAATNQSVPVATNKTQV